MKKYTIVLSAAALALSLGACSTSPEEAQENTQNANAAACAALDGFRGQIQTLVGNAASAASSGEQVTVGQAQEAIEQLQDQWDEAGDALKDVQSSAREQFEMALDKYNESIQNIDKADSLASARGQVASAQRQLQADYDSVLGELGC